MAAIVILAVGYVLTGLGVTVGFHRLFTHRSFQTSPAMRYLFAVLGEMAVESDVITWVADHRKHHQFSDQQGDPHSPHAGYDDTWRGTRCTASGTRTRAGSSSPPAAPISAATPKT